MDFQINQNYGFLIILTEFLVIWGLYYHKKDIYSFFDACWFYINVFCGVVMYICFAKASVVTSLKGGEIVREIRIG